MYNKGYIFRGNQTTEVMRVFSDKGLKDFQNLHSVTCTDYQKIFRRCFLYYKNIFKYLYYT